MVYSYLADAIVAAHVAYVGFIVAGQLAILIGAGLKWQWIRNPWFRFGHLGAIGIVAVEAILGIMCPLTVWEQNLRELAGQEVAGGSFIGRLFDWLLFYNASESILNACHIGFAVLVIATLVLVPPYWGKVRGFQNLSSN
jgi:hypothetical protein